MNFYATENGHNHINITINQMDANTISRRGQNWIAEQRVPQKEVYHEKVFYWYQARDTYANKTGDKGIIESITSKYIDVFISNPEIKTKMIEGDFFNKFYLVDVQVETIENKPKLYKIIKLISAYDK